MADNNDPPAQDPSGTQSVASGLARNLPLGIPPSAVHIDYVRSRGAGGQHVNKVSTAVQLRLMVRDTELPLRVQTRMLHLAGTKATKSDEIILRADRHRTQTRNRKDALDRLRDLVRDAQVVPKQRRATRPSKASQRRRVDSKTRRGTIKKLRGKPTDS